MWLLIGVGLGLALSGIVLIWVGGPLLRKRDLPQPNPAATAPVADEPAIADEAAKPKKSFDFYQVLPEMEVVIPDAELTAKARAEQQARTAAAATTTPAATGGVRYVLQAGSYPDAKAADEAKAKLALSGFSARIQPVTINGKTWHRVRVGPYATARELDDARRTLTANGIDAIALREKQ
jgi:cell division protein FtsN